MLAFSGRQAGGPLDRGALVARTFVRVGACMRRRVLVRFIFEKATPKFRKMSK